MKIELKRLAPLLCGVLAVFFLTSCGESGTCYADAVENYAYDAYAYDTEHPTDEDYTADEIHDELYADYEEIAALEHTPFTGDLLTYEYLWQEGRNREWEEDIIYFASTFWQNHPLLDSGLVALFTLEQEKNIILNSTRFGRPHVFLADEWLRVEFLDIINDLILRIPELTDFEILMGMYRSIAITSDCHSGIVLPMNYTLPIVFVNHFDEQYSETSCPFPWPHIWSAYAGFGDIIGYRVLAINGTDIDEIFNLKRPLFPHENEAGFRALNSTNMHLGNRDILRYIGVVDDEDIIPIALRGLNGAVSTVYAPFVRSLDDVEMVRHIIDTEEYFMASRIEEDFWFRYFPEEDMMFVRIRRFAPAVEWRERQGTRPEEKEHLPCVQFKYELVDAITEQSGVGVLVIDFRDNMGGSRLEGVDRLFAWVLADENRDLLGSVYIVTSQATYSNGVIHALLFRTYIDDAILIGEPPAGALNLFGGFQTFALPNSQVIFWIGGESFWALDPSTETNTLYPDIFVYRTAEDFINNHDAVIETIRQRHTPDAE